jgi:hypothetical protein
VDVVGVGLVADVQPFGEHQPDVVQCRGPVPRVRGGQHQLVLVQVKRGGAQRADLAFPQGAFGELPELKRGCGVVLYDVWQEPPQRAV